MLIDISIRRRSRPISFRKEDAGHGLLRFNPCPQGLQPDRESLPLTFKTRAAARLLHAELPLPSRSARQPTFASGTVRSDSRWWTSLGRADVPALSNNARYEIGMSQVFHREEKRCRAWTEKQHSACGEFQSMPQRTRSYMSPSLPQRWCSTAGPMPPR